MEKRVTGALAGVRELAPPSQPAAEPDPGKHVRQRTSRICRAQPFNSKGPSGAGHELRPRPRAPVVVDRPVDLHRRPPTHPTPPDLLGVELPALVSVNDPPCSRSRAPCRTRLTPTPWAERPTADPRARNREGPRASSPVSPRERRSFPLAMGSDPPPDISLD